MELESPYCDLALPAVTLEQYVTARFEKHAARTALVDNVTGEQITYGELRHQIRQMAAALQNAGLKRGDVVVVSEQNSLRYPITLLAASACGAAVTACNPLSSKNEMLQLLRIVEPCMIFAGQEAVNTVEMVARELLSVKKIYVFGDGKDYQGTHESFTDLLAGASAEDYCPVSLDIDNDIAVIPFSSGTTGLPKGIEHSHRTWTTTAHIFSHHLGVFACDCCYMDRAMSHAYGHHVLISCLRVGAKLVFGRKFDAEKMLQAVEQHKVTHLALAPPDILGLVQTTINGKYDTSSLRRIISGGASTPPSLVSAVSEKYKVIVSIGYGLSEFAPATFCDPLKYTDRSIGPVCANTTVKIVDTSNGQSLGPGFDGEIMVKGPQMAKGYYRNQRATAATFEDGWMHTGDIGHYDDDGMVYIVGRCKEMIKYKTIQVPPAEIEAVLVKHPGITDAAVIGVPDQAAGELPKGFVVKSDPMLSEADVKAYIKGELLDHKRLRGGVKFVDAISRNRNGKINRQELKKWMD